VIESNQPKKPIPPGLHGGDRRSAGARSSSQNENLKAFVADIAVKTGKGRSTVARDVTRAKKVAVLDDIAGTCLDKGDEIDALGKLPEGEQRKLATAARAGEKVSAKARKPRQKGADTSVSFRVRFLVLEKFQPDRGVGGQGCQSAVVHVQLASYRVVEVAVIDADDIERLSRFMGSPTYDTEQRVVAHREHQRPSMVPDKRFRRA
jgi:hypothetical protein